MPRWWCRAVGGGAPVGDVIPEDGVADELEVEPRCVAVVVLDVVLGTAGVVLDDPSRVPLTRGRAVGWRRVVRESCKGGLLDRRERRAEPRAEWRPSGVEWGWCSV